MSVIKRMRRQKAVYWQRLGADPYGKFSYSTPVEIKCRWEDRRGEFRNQQGEIMKSVATVYVDRVMFLNDKLKKGEMDSHTPTDPKDDPEAFEIQGFEQIPNLRVTETLFIASL